MSRLTQDEISLALQTLPDWRLEADVLVTNRSFADFAEAMRFVNSVAALAERLDHHPNIDVRYNKVRLGLWSHDAGGITGRDLRFARELREIEAG